jgi:hypothetical protein
MNPNAERQIGPDNGWILTLGTRLNSAANYFAFKSGSD